MIAIGFLSPGFSLKKTSAGIYKNRQDAGFMKKFGLHLSVLILHATISSAQTHQDWSYNKTIYEVNVRQYTEAGTFTAFETHLERLQELRAGILWFMPIHPIGEKNRLGSLGSYYSVRDYFAVNPEFGSIDEFKSLVDKAHAMGFHVILDWVANHTSWDNSLTLSNPEWYTRDENGDFQPPAGTDYTDVIELDYNQQGLREYMIDAMTFWIQETGIDGFRCDAVSWVPLDFWETAISELKNLKPEILMLAEDDGPQYRNAGFDMTYAWAYHGFGSGILKRIVQGASNATGLSNYVISEQNLYSDGHYRMVFTSNHDENSWYGTDLEQFGDAAETFAVLTSLMNGMPLIYSGQEAGLDKRLLFFDKDKITWQPHRFAEIYSTLFQLKKENPALWNGVSGGAMQRVATSHDSVYAFVRRKNGDKIFTVLNLSCQNMNVTLHDTLCTGHYTDVFTGDILSLAKGSNLELGEWMYKVYERTGESTGISKNHDSLTEAVLSQNHPNPFNLTTNITFSLPRAMNVKVIIINSRGETVKALIHDHVAQGFHIITWDSRNDAGTQVPGGMYFYQVISESQTLTGKMLLLR
jgi:cyclomaltodextrinase